MDIISSGAECCVKLSFEDNNPGVCFLSGLSVLPEHRRMGFATEVMGVAEQLCEKDGIFRIDLSSVSVPFVVRFYKKIGFVPVKEEDGFIQMYKMLKRHEATLH